MERFLTSLACGFVYALVILGGAFVAGAPMLYIATHYPFSTGIWLFGGWALILVTAIGTLITYFESNT